MNTTEVSMSGGDVAICQITLTTCLFKLLLLGHIAVLSTYMQPIVTDRVAWSVCRSVIEVSPAKTAEPIKMPIVICLTYLFYVEHMLYKII